MSEYNTKNYTEQGGDVTHIGGKLIFDEGAIVEGFPGGSGGSGCDVPDATVETRGIVMSAENQAEISTTDMMVLVRAFNSLLAKLKNAGLMAPDVAPVGT